MNKFEAHVRVGERIGIQVEVKAGDVVLIKTMGTGIYDSLSMYELDVLINTLRVARDVMSLKDDLARIDQK